MESPFLFKSDRPITWIGRVFGTPLGVQGISWLPLNELFFWILFTWQSVRQHTIWRWTDHILLGAAKMAVMLGSEWCHNIAHTAVARAIGKPVNYLRIILGMPVLIYLEPEHPSVTPRQHILRSLGGPLCSAFLFLFSRLFQKVTPPGSPVREVANVAVGMNTFITLASLIPNPAFDGGPIFKWSLVSFGVSPSQAERYRIYANRWIGVGLLGASIFSLRKSAPLRALIFCGLGLIALSSGLEKVKRHNK